MTARKRRPTTRDRDLVDRLEALPDGEHILILEDDGVMPPFKAEGGFVARIPKGLRRMVLLPSIASKGRIAND
jgi:hypothetical protein